MSSKYKTAPNEQSGGTLQFRCCDCSLVHKLGFTVRKGGAIGLTFERKERSTAALRRHRVGYLFEPLKSDKWKIVRK